LKKLFIIGGVAVAVVVIGVLVLLGKINPIVKNGVEKAGRQSSKLRLPLMRLKSRFSPVPVNCKASLWAIPRATRRLMLSVWTA